VARHFLCRLLMPIDPGFAVLKHCGHLNLMPAVASSVVPMARFAFNAIVIWVVRISIRLLEVRLSTSFSDEVRWSGP
jgi:hypothetical protein